ncbi:Ig-like domain repeat protein [Mumia quercus]|uniref:Ig-like domain repeat protein n=1 Tax=Mumia quercus TaxID=2976125 RepID=UPI0021D04CD8|nr:Ig-like domain repeat protein [Mumia quercus]
MSQAFYFEPASGQAWTDRDVVDTASWTAWDSPSSSEYFYLKSAERRGLDERCLQLGHLVADIEVRPCNDSPNQKFEFKDFDNDPDRAQKTQGEKDRLTARVLGSAMEFAAQRCAFLKTDCALQLRDRTSGVVLSDWDRIDQLTIDARPQPVIRATGCASGGGPQSIYNGGSEPMSTTIGASATSEISSSVTTSLAVENTFSFGKDSAFFKYELKVTASVAYGRTWTDSTTVSQDVQWTIPPRRFATATLATASVLGTSSWRMNARPGSAHPWETKDVVELAIPYAARANASAPDTTLAVHNSWGQKMCDADPATVLAEGRQVSVTNTTAPDAGPIPGDVLTANADPAWWEEPRSIGSPAPGVNLIYQWYRQRGSEAPSPIPGATKKNYTVTGDDVTDDEIVEWVGPYHLYVGVTDVANANRFDSIESFAVATDATRSERAPNQTGPKETVLRLSVENPGTTATKDTVLSVEARAEGATSPPSGTVTIHDNGVVLTDVALGADGTARKWVRLAPGVHDLDATYLGDGSVGAAVSNRTRTTVTKAASTTTLRVPSSTRAQTETTARVVVAGDGDAPTGTVRIYDGGTPLGRPAELDGDGSAQVTLPGFAATGRHDLSARYLGDGTYASSSSDQRLVDVSELPTTTRVDVTGAAVAGGMLELAAQVRSSGGVPVGTVQFTDHGRPLGEPVALRAGVAKTTVRGLSAGERFLFGASYDGTDPYASSTSVDRPVTVAAASTSVAVRTSRTVVAAGDQVALRAKVTARGADIRGTVRFFADGRALGSRVVDGDGVATLRTSRFEVGKNRVSVAFLPASGAPLAGATSPTVVQTVRRHRAVVRARTDRAVLRRRDRLEVTGSVRIAGRPSAALTVRRVWLVIDGRRMVRGSVRADGTYALRLAARKLTRGRHAIRVDYVGSKRPSVAPSTSRVVVVRRR